MTRLSRFLVLVPAALMATPAMAQQQGLTLGTVFGDAAPSMKLLMLLLIVAMIASIVIAVRKIMAGPALVGGSAFLSALRLGGPLIGLLGAAFNGVHMFIGISNSPDPVPFNVMAPGFAEAMTIAMLGLLAGVVAVICHWAVESRIDRAVLRP
jgi:MotA/TolQ/ExbB proton channel family